MGRTSLRHTFACTHTTCPARHISSSAYDKRRLEHEAPCMALLPPNQQCPLHLHGHTTPHTPHSIPRYQLAAPENPILACSPPLILLYRTVVPFVLENNIPVKFGSAVLWILTTYRIVVIFSRTFHIPVHGLSQIFKISNFEVFFQLELETVSHKTSLFPNTHLVSLNHSFSPFLMFLTNMSLTL